MSQWLVLLVVFVIRPEMRFDQKGHVVSFWVILVYSNGKCRVVQV